MIQKLLDELAVLVEEGVARSELIREAAGGGTPILPRNAIYIVNRLRRLSNEANSSN